MASSLNVIISFLPGFLKFPIKFWHILKDQLWGDNLWFVNDVNTDLFPEQNTIYVFMLYIRDLTLNKCVLILKINLILLTIFKLQLIQYKFWCVKESFWNFALWMTRYTVISRTTNVHVIFFLHTTRKLWDTLFYKILCSSHR